MSMCEWDPERDAPAEMRIDEWDERGHAPATVVVGSGRNNWHLCASCADLPRFRRFRARTPIASDAEAGGE